MSVSYTVATSVLSNQWALLYVIGCLIPVSPLNCELHASRALVCSVYPISQCAATRTVHL